MIINVPIRWNIVNLSPRMINEKKAETMGVNERIILAFPISRYVRLLYQRNKLTP